MPVVYATTSREKRPQNRGRLAHQVVEPEELARLAFRHEPPEERARQRLDAALHEPDDDGERIELALRSPGSTRSRAAAVYTAMADEDARLRPDRSCRASRTRAPREAHELRDQQRRDQARLIRAPATTRNPPPS